MKKIFRSIFALLICSFIFTVNVSAATDYKYDKENQRYLGVSRHNPDAYLWGCGTDEYIYLLYSGKNYADDGEKTFVSSQIEVYNWEGEKVKTLMLDIPIQGMVVSEDDSTMYAIALNPEPQIVAFDL